MHACMHTCIIHTYIHIKIGILADGSLSVLCERSRLVGRWTLHVVVGMSVSRVEVSRCLFRTPICHLFPEPPAIQGIAARATTSMIGLSVTVIAM